MSIMSFDDSMTSFSDSRRLCNLRINSNHVSCRSGFLSLREGIPPSQFHVEFEASQWLTIPQGLGLGLESSLRPLSTRLVD